MPRDVSWLGWRPDIPDHRDQQYSFTRALAEEVAAPRQLPPSARPQRKETDKHGVLDQGPTGSCTGHGVGLIVAVERNVAKRSAYALYWGGRLAISETDRDEGAYIRDVVKYANTGGAPVYKLWPSLPENLYVDPPAAADRDAAKRKIFSYHRLDDDYVQGVDRAQAYRSCLAAGHLFTIGFSVYSNIDDPMVERFGILGWPSGSFDGGHCVAVIGYDDNFQQSEWASWARSQGFPESRIPAAVYECQNSWGDWGRGGRFVIDATYLEHPYLADDAWTIRGFADERK